MDAFCVNWGTELVDFLDANTELSCFIIISATDCASVRVPMEGLDCECANTER